MAFHSLCFAYRARSAVSTRACAALIRASGSFGIYIGLRPIHFGACFVEFLPGLFKIDLAPELSMFSQHAYVVLQHFQEPAVDRQKVLLPLEV